MSARQERKARKEAQRAGDKVFVHVKPQKRQVKPPRSRREVKAYIKKYDPPMKTEYVTDATESTPASPVAAS